LDRFRGDGRRRLADRRKPRHARHRLGLRRIRRSAQAAWIVAGLEGDELSVVITDGILLVINLFAVWRWLGRQSRYEDSGARAAAHSRGAPVPTLFPAGSLVGASIKGPDDATRGVVAEAMLNCDDKSLAYLVVGEGGVAGAGETLRVLAPEALRLHGDSVRC
jgi:hypothetical protein